MSKCGKEVKRAGEHERTVETMIGEIKLKRPYFWRESCKKGFYPLDEVLDLSNFLQWTELTCPRAQNRQKGRGRKKGEAKRARWNGEWREAKGFRFYLVDGDRLDHVLCWHQVQSSEELEESLRKVKEAGLIPERDKTISHARLKRPGARWYVEKANHMLALRCSKYNGTFQKLFQRYAREPRKRRMYKRSKNG